MKNQVTFSHILVILAIIVIPLLVWGINVEKRFEQVIDNTDDIKSLEMADEKNAKKDEQNHKEVMKSLHNIELQLKDKKDK